MLGQLGARSDCQRMAPPEHRWMAQSEFRSMKVVDFQSASSSPEIETWPGLNRRAHGYSTNSFEKRREQPLRALAHVHPRQARLRVRGIAPASVIPRVFSQHHTCVEHGAARTCIATPAAFPASRSGMTRNPLAEKWFGITGDGPVRLVRVPSATVFEFASQRNPGPGVCG